MQSCKKGDTEATKSVIDGLIDYLIKILIGEPSCIEKAKISMIVVNMIFSPHDMMATHKQQYAITVWHPTTTEDIRREAI